MIVILLVTPACSLVGCHRRFGGTYNHYLRLPREYGVTRFSETSVTAYNAVSGHNPEDHKPDS